jgi:hypothetical protein
LPSFHDETDAVTGAVNYEAPCRSPKSVNQRISVSGVVTMGDTDRDRLSCHEVILAFYLSWLGELVSPRAAPAALLFVGAVIATIGATIGSETRDVEF